MEPHMMILLMGLDLGHPHRESLQGNSTGILCVGLPHVRILYGGPSALDSNLQLESFTRKNRLNITESFSSLQK